MASPPPQDAARAPAVPVPEQASLPSTSNSAASAPAATATSASATSTNPPQASSKPPKPPNPVFRMMGIPNLPKKLPSRNWMIFWTVLVSFSAAKLYDSREKKRVQKKWCDLVAHIAQEPLGTSQLPRKMTVYIAAPPGDGMSTTRQYFKDYIKPILVSASMDYDVIEGRKEGDVRYGTAEQIRRLRRKKGERGLSGEEPELDTIMAVDMVRDKLQVMPYEGIRGDLVLGRHTWKEYIRGVHEGWLGPLEEPPEPVAQPLAHPIAESPTEDSATTTSSIPTEAGQSSDSVIEEPKKEEEEKEKKKKPYPPNTFLPVSQYADAQLSPHIPQSLEPSTAIYQQHLLGFLKTPIRIYNWLNRRSLQDHIGRQVAAVVLAQSRPYTSQETFASTSASDLDASPLLATRSPESDISAPATVQTSESYEQQTLLQEEEPTWHKSVHKQRPEGDDLERIWTKEIVLDPRIASRMRHFEIDPEEEARATRIFNGQEASRAVEVVDLRQQKPIIDNLDQDSME